MSIPRSYPISSLSTHRKFSLTQSPRSSCGSPSSGSSSFSSTPTKIFDFKSEDSCVETSLEIKASFYSEENHKTFVEIMAQLDNGESKNNLSLRNNIKYYRENESIDSSRVLYCSLNVYEFAAMCGAKDNKPELLEKLVKKNFPFSSDVTSCYIFHLYPNISKELLAEFKKIEKKHYECMLKKCV